MSDWISVKDRMPEVYKRVLVINNHLMIYAAEYLYLDDDHYWNYQHCCECGVDNVTHWMPLPEGPKDE